MNTDILTNVINRRSGLVNGFKAAFAAPAVVAALHTGVAYADKGTKQKGSKNTGTHTGTNVEVAGVQTGTGTNTGTNTATGTSTRAELEGLNVLLSGNLATLPGLNNVLGSLHLFGLNGVVSKLLVRIRGLERKTLFQLVFRTSTGSTTVVQLSTNGSGKFHKVLSVNLNLASFTDGVFVLQQFDGTKFVDALQLVKA
jgi:hypothetical protein